MAAWITQLCFFVCPATNDMAARQYISAARPAATLLALNGSPAAGKTAARYRIAVRCNGDDPTASPPVSWPVKTQFAPDGEHNRSIISRVVTSPQLRPAPLPPHGRRPTNKLGLKSVRPFAMLAIVAGCAGMTMLMRLWLSPDMSRGLLLAMNTALLALTAVPLLWWRFRTRNRATAARLQVEVESRRNEGCWAKAELKDSVGQRERPQSSSRSVAENLLLPVMILRPPVTATPNETKVPQ